MNELSVAVFIPIVAELESLAADAKKVDISDLNAVRETRLILKNKRVEVTKKCKEFRDDANAFSKAVIAKEKELVSIIAPEEERLDEIESEAKRLKEKEERKALLPVRLERLASIGDKVLEEGEPDFEDFLLGMDGSTFEGYFNQRLAAKNEADRAEIARKEAALKEKEEAVAREEEAKAREEKARQEEREKLEREAKEKEEREEREEKEEQERKNLEFKEKMNARHNARIEKLVSLGLTYSLTENSYLLEDINVHLVELKTLNDEEWGTLVGKLSTEITRRNEAKLAEELRIAKEEAEAEEKRKLEASKKFQTWLKEQGYSEETKAEFKLVDNGDSVTLYKLIGNYKK